MATRFAGHAQYTSKKLSYNERVALATIDQMSEAKFQEFLATIPRRVLSRIENGTSFWRDVLPKYYIKAETES